MPINITIFFFVVIAISAVIHEYFHGWVADRLGDPTPRLAGRLTLNPLAHLDPIGTLLLPLVLFFLSGGSFLFAFAKPVPINPENIKDKSFGLAKVAVAGPGSNLALALSFGLLIRFLPIVNSWFFSNFISYLGMIVYVNLLLAVFNLVPIPPLDGSKILFTLLPEQFHNFKVFLQTYGLIFLFIFIFFLFGLIMPVIRFLFKIITGYDFS